MHAQCSLSSSLSVTAVHTNICCLFVKCLDTRRHKKNGRNSLWRKTKQIHMANKRYTHSTSPSSSRHSTLHSPIEQNSIRQWTMQTKLCSFSCVFTICYVLIVLIYSSSSSFFSFLFCFVSSFVCEIHFNEKFKYCYKISRS